MFSFSCVYVPMGHIFYKIYSKSFANGPGDLGSIPGRVIPNTFKMVLDTYLLNRVKWNNPGKGVESFPTLGVVAIKKGAFWLPSTKGRQLYLLFTIICALNSTKMIIIST